MSMTDREIEWEIRIAACAPRRFYDIAERFYVQTKADTNDKVLWGRFFQACKRILVDSGEDGPFTLLIAPPAAVAARMETSTTEATV